MRIENQRVLILHMSVITHYLLTIIQQNPDACSPYSWTSKNSETVKSLFFPNPSLQHATQSKRGIEHSVMFKDHLIKGVQRQATCRICVFQCGHGHVQAVGLVAERRLLGCDNFNCLLDNENKNISTQQGGFSKCIFQIDRQILNSGVAAARLTQHK